MELSRRLFGGRLKANSSVTEPYTYEPLPSAQALRLLKLSKSPSDGKPVCSLNAFKLEPCPAFTALSYTWGEPMVDRQLATQAQSYDEGCEILIKSSSRLHRFPVSKNLYDCLTTLNQKKFSDYLWVDAVCINQSDATEKANQILNMGIIYGAAGWVYIWLGPYVSYVDDVQWINRELYEAIIRYMYQRGGLDLSRSWNLPSPQDYYNEIGAPDPGNRWIGYDQFFKQFRWFGRGWVFQEVVLARHVLLLCGHEELSWDVTTLVVNWIRATGLSSYLALANFSPEWDKFRGSATLGSEIQIFSQWRQKCLDGGPARQDRGSDIVETLVLQFNAFNLIERCYGFLEMAVELIRTLDVTDPRDHIYAAIGMYTRYLPSDYSPSIYPDYGMSVEDVYHYATMRLLQVLPWLSILSHVDDPSTRKMIHLPSWVPDFSAKPTKLPSFMEHPGHQYNSSIPRHQNIPVRYRYFDGNALAVYGVKVDVVTATCFSTSDNPKNAGTPQSRNWLNYIGSLLDMCFNIPPTYVNGQSRVEVLWRTLLLNSSPRDYPVGLEYGLKFRDWIRMYLVTWGIHNDLSTDELFQSCINILGNFEALQPLDCLPTLKSIWELIDLGKAPGPLSVEDGRRFHEMIRVQDEMTIMLSRTQYTRRIFRTSEGLLGVGCDSVAVGDELWQFYDARVPFVLRKVPDTPDTPDKPLYRIFGESYVHGCMMGELMERHDLAARVGLVTIV